MVQGYLRNAAVLTVASLVLRGAGMGLRVYLAGRLGGEGMGLYQLVFTLYGVCIAAATAGINVAAARIPAETLAAGDGRATRRVLRRLVGLGAGLGAAAGAFQFVLAQPLSCWLLGEQRAAAALQVLAFSLPFMAAGAAFRGFFMASRNVVPNAAAQLAEQLVRVAVVVWAVEKARGQSLGMLCAAAVLGNTVSEAVSCFLVAGAACRAVRRLPQAAPVRPAPRWSAQQIWAVMLPVQGSRLLSSGLHAAESSLVPACLTLFLGSRGQALAQFGALRGMALPLVTFPFSLLSALSGLLMPEIARVHIRNDHHDLEKIVGRMMVLTMGVSLFAGAFFVVWGDTLAFFIYSEPLAARYVTLLGLVVPFMYLESMVDGVMKGLGEQMAVFRYGMADSLLRLAGVVLLLPRFGMLGFLAVMAFSNIFTCVLNCRRMLGVTGIAFRWGRWVVRPAFCLMAALGLCLCLQNIPWECSRLMHFLVAGGGMTLCYGALLWRCSLRELLAGERR